MVCNENDILLGNLNVWHSTCLRAYFVCIICVCVAHLYVRYAFEWEHGCALNGCYAFFGPCVQTGRVAFLRYSYSELHIHLIVDFLQSAKAQNDEVAELHKRGLLSPDVVKMFGDVCCQAVQKVYQLKNLPWQVKVCCWEEDEESDREMRSVEHWGMHKDKHWMRICFTAGSIHTISTYSWTLCFRFWCNFPYFSVLM